MTAPQRVVIEADGGSRGNPGPAGYGALVRDRDTGALLAERAEAIGVATNNVAEYGGLIAGLRAAADLGAREVEVRMDSKLVVEQMSGRWQVKHPGLRPLAREAATVAAEFDTVRYTWIPRARNADADRLANRAMDGETIRTRHDAVAAPDPSVPAGPISPAGTDNPAVWAVPGATATTTATRIVLVRHAATALTAGRLFSGRGDPQLSPTGEWQAAALAARLAEIAPGTTAIVSSPLARAARTAQSVRAALGAPVSTDDDLVECDFGAWEGLSYGAVRERWPTEMAAWTASTAVAPPGGESIDAVAVRAGRAFARLVADHRDGIVVVVSHVTPIKAILRAALDAGPALLHRLVLEPTGISLLDAYADGGLAVRTVNDTAHLTGRP